MTMQIFARAAGLAAAVATGVVGFRLVRYLLNRKLRRPYNPLGEVGAVTDLECEMQKVVSFIQDSVIRPIDSKFRGHPFSADLQSFPLTPMVLVIGNHSSGKSTFINDLLGRQVQETGVAPTDDGFTILERARPPSIPPTEEDGPTLLGCPQNRPFQELKRFGEAFLGHFRRKRILLPDGASMPYGLQIVDSPGMIDTPGDGVRGRGYNFVEVVRWWAKRSDLILILFDPDKPGTTGESLDVLTKSLSGLEYKFRIVLNKVDGLDNVVDFARAYGTLGWALSKVIPRKDIPIIYTTCNEAFADKAQSSVLPLDEFDQSRRNVVSLVHQAKERHWDNAITTLERVLRQVEMVSAILRRVRVDAMRQQLLGPVLVLGALSLPGAVLTWALGGAYLGLIMSSYVAVYACSGALLRLNARQFAKLQCTDGGLNEAFEAEYSELFIHGDREDYRADWSLARPLVSTILQSSPNMIWMKSATAEQIAKVRECLETDIWYLRQLARARRLKMQDSGSAAAPTAPRAPPGANDAE